MILTFNLKMFDTERRVIVVKSCGYESVLKHSHEFVELVYIVSGSCVNLCGTERMELKQHDFLMIPIGQTHTMRPTCAENDFQIINIIFDPSVAVVDLKQFDCCRSVNIESLPSLIDLIYKMVEEYDAGRDYCDTFNAGYANLLLGHFARLINDKGRNDGTYLKSSSSYVQAVVDYIHANYNKKFTVDELCKSVGLSKGYVQRQFRAERNTTVVEYLLRYRIEQACRLILEREDMKVEEICEKVCFSDLKNFYSLFKKLTGTTPKSYRVLYKNAAIAGRAAGDTEKTAEDANG